MDIQWTQILFQIINFGVVAGALTFLLYKPVLKIFDERARRIEEGQKAAEEALETRDNLEKARSEMKTGIKKERAQILEEAQDEAKKRAAEIVAAAKKEAAAELEKQRGAWADERTQLVNDTKDSLAEAVVKTAEVVLSESLDAKKHSKLIDQELTKLLKQV